MRHLFLVATLLSACAGGGESTAKPRVDAVATAKVDPAKIAGFCERHDAADVAKPFSFPPLEPAAPGAATGWRWVNIWATWCGPCVAEMPTLFKWKEKLAAQGQDVELVLMSADDKAELVTAWKAKHPELPVGDLRIKSSLDMSDWLPKVGLDASTAIPLHFFVDPAGKVRCVRAGAIDPGDFELVKAILSGA